MLILHAQVGYEVGRAKRAVLRCEGQAAPESFTVCRASDGAVVLRGNPGAAEPIDNWPDGPYAVLDFSTVDEPGAYRIEVPGAQSETIVIGADRLVRATAWDVMDYFKSQRCSGAYDRFDRAVPIEDSDRTVDVHGGWYDASGDRSKYLSHLSYANYFNPQQTPMVPWVCAAAWERLADKAGDSLVDELRLRLLDEAAHGGDFLVRMLDESGAFYATIFDGWSHEPQKRSVCSYRDAAGTKLPQWQAGFRQGGGMAIAALARLSVVGAQGEYGPAQYLAAARRGLDHLVEHGRRWLPDGRENIIDDYCALSAATQMYRATSESNYLSLARDRAQGLIDRLHADDDLGLYWRADDDRRPYAHAAEAGLPTLALLDYAAVEADATRGAAARRAAARSMQAELDRAQAVTNPFGLARQVVVDTKGTRWCSYFMAQDNETGYWWQGENARLASLAAAARHTAASIAESPGGQPQLVERLSAYATAQLDWILGTNPYDACMLHGHGRNNPHYSDGCPPSAGGIANGVTADPGDERGRPCYDPPDAHGRADKAWRWTEQWLPHSTWYLLAIVSG